MVRNIAGKFINKIHLLLKKEIDLKDLILDVASHLVSLCKPQRRLRRKFFPIGKVICNSLSAADQAAYQRFLYSYSAYFRTKERAKKNSQEVPLSSFDISPKSLFYVARYKDSIVGAVGVRHKCSIDDRGLWELSGLVILKSYQGLGIAAKLIKTVSTSFKDRKRIIFLSVDPGNFRAINLYRKNGFREDEAFSDKARDNNYLSLPQCPRRIFYLF